MSEPKRGARRAMMTIGNVWALVLAAGEGTRLRSLTTTADGLTVPKQFCSLHSGASLLEEALQRAQCVARVQHVTTVVAEQHRNWWDAPLRAFPRENVVVQPDNKGTAAGLLLPLVRIMRRDPDAVVVVLPADHFVRDERVLARSVGQAARFARADQDHVYLLGLSPERFDTELGYILPDEGIALGAAPVARFVEKPDSDRARSLVDGGALWNAFILAASARALLGLYENRHAGLARSMTRAVRHDALHAQDPTAVRRLYTTLPSLDFSRDILEAQERLLRVVKVPNCGWSDLGTPQRVAETLGRHRPCYWTTSRGRSSAHLSLADQHFRQRAV